MADYVAALARFFKRRIRQDPGAEQLGALGIGWFRSTESGRTLAANRQMMEILGLPSLAELKRINAADLHYDAGTRETWKQLLAQSGTVTGFELRMRRADGSPVWVRQSARVVGTSRGERVYEGTIEDVTHERQLAEQLSESEERYRLVTSSANVGIVSIDADSTIIFANPAMQRIFGHTPEAMVGRKLTMLIPESQRAAHERGMARYMATRERHLDWDCIRINGLHKSGAEIPVEISFGEYRTATTTFFTGVIHDVTSQVLAEQNRRALEDELFQSRKMEAVGRLAGGIAHDFNNLLTTILGLADLTLADPSLPSAIREDVEEIRRSGIRAAEMTQQLLAFSRKQVLQPRPVDLKEIVQNAERMLDRLIGEQYQLRIRAGQEPAPVFADPAQLEQVILNLIVNARDAMPDGGPIDIKVRPVNREGHSFIELAVRDQGTGIDARVLPNIFDPFFTTKEQGKGTGLGLSTVDGIVRQSGGFVDVESSPNSGSTFRVYFPRAELHEIPAREAPPELPPVRRANILLVEDEAAVRKLTRKLLERAGYHVTEAASPAEALALTPDLLAGLDILLTDVVMPGMNGHDLASRLLEEYPHLKVVFISGYAEEAVRRHGRLAPGGAFLKKPFTRDQLISTVAAAGGASLIAE